MTSGVNVSQKLIHQKTRSHLSQLASSCFIVRSLERAISWTKPMWVYTILSVRTILRLSICLVSSQMSIQDRNEKSLIDVAIRWLICEWDHTVPIC